MLSGLLFTSLDSFGGYDTVDQYQPTFWNMKEKKTSHILESYSAQHVTLFHVQMDFGADNLEQ